MAGINTYPLGAFENRRSYLSIANLVFILENLIKSDNTSYIPRPSSFVLRPPASVTRPPSSVLGPPSSVIYHLADDEPLSTNQVIELMASSLNRPPRIWKINADLVRRLARLGDHLPLALNSERLKKLTESYVVSNKKLKHALGIDHLPVTASAGMLSTLQSFQKH